MVDEGIGDGDDVVCGIDGEALLDGQQWAAHRDAEGSRVETIDLLPAFLRERQAGAGKAEALYQAQDTHWTTRGLELAAKLVGKRIKRFPWYKGIAAHRRAFHTKDEPFTRHGDLHSRLPEAERARG